MGVDHDKTTASEPPRGPHENPPRGPGDGLSSGAMGEQPGEFIGPYKLLQVIGEGGFGIVWLAERREPMVQRVALKIIKPGMDSKAVIARFEQERQALAVMDHPNVAKVFDGGITPPHMGSRPYFVMEHVKGEPITEFCDRHRMTIRERLELFIPVCEAVQHAHMKGIIHRDLKPGNILVSTVDTSSMSDVGSGMSESRRGSSHPASAIPHPTSLVKVIDFGVAKAISHTLTEKTIFTEAGQLIGTPEYMSPEQAEMGALDIDTRTDVYSLGVVLYELLTGLLPFDAKELRSKGYVEIQRVIREVEPPTPSKRLTDLGDMGAEAARRRHAAPEELAQELRRELEWVPLRALRKDRRHRYATPQDLANDVHRYLRLEPLQAGPDSIGYSFYKWSRRHRKPLLVAAVTVAVACIVIPVFMTLRERTDRAEAMLLSKELEIAERRNANLRLLASRMDVSVAQRIGQIDGGNGSEDQASRARLSRLLLEQNSQLEAAIAVIEARKTSTLDPSVQAILREELTRGLDDADAVGGRAIVVDSYTGWVLGQFAATRDVPELADYPWDSLEHAASRRYKTVQGLPRLTDANQNPDSLDAYINLPFEPGGMFRPFVWAICTDLGVAGRRTRLDWEGGQRKTPYGRFIADKDKRLNGTWANALIEGSNVAFTKVVEEVEFNELRERLMSFGFGSPPGVTLNGNVGIVTASDSWTKYTQTSVAMGKEIALTGFQLARAFAVFAQPNGIDPRMPEIAFKMKRPLDGHGVAAPVSPASVMHVRELLTEVAARMPESIDNSDAIPHTALSAFGAAGSSEIPLLLVTPPGKHRAFGSSGYFDHQYTSGCVLAGPIDSPRFIVLILIDDPGPQLVKGQRHHGSIVAGPVARRVLARCLPLHQPDGGGGP